MFFVSFKFVALFTSRHPLVFPYQLITSTPIYQSFFSIVNFTRDSHSSWNYRFLHFMSEFSYYICSCILGPSFMHSINSSPNIRSQRSKSLCYVLLQPFHLTPVSQRNLTVSLLVQRTRFSLLMIPQIVVPMNINCNKESLV